MIIYVQNINIGIVALNAVVGFPLLSCGLPPIDIIGRSSKVLTATYRPQLSIDELQIS